MTSLGSYRDDVPILRFVRVRAGSDVDPPGVTEGAVDSGRESWVLAPS